MFKITLKKYNDSVNYVLHNQTTKDLLLINPKLKLELNKTGTLTFSVPVTHPYYSHIAKMQCEITVYKDDKIIYVGRPLTSEEDFYETSSVTCEGILAYLIDSKQRPYEHKGSINDFLSGILTNHNNSVDDYKRFIFGVCDVTDSNNYINRSDSSYTDSLTTINEKLIKTHGGYLSVRYEGRKRFLDYKSQPGKENKQVIRFGENLLDLSKYIKSDNLITAIIPLGAETEKEGINGAKKRVTIEKVNDGKDYIVDEAAVKQFGLIYGVVEFDDVTLPLNLKTKAQKYLDDNKNLSLTIELSAVDLSVLNADIEDFALGDMIRVISAPHKLDKYFLLSAYELDLVDPSKNKIILGKTLSKLTQTVNKNQNENTINLIKKTEALNADISNAVENATQLITGSQGGYLYFKSNEDGQPEELYILDSPTVDDAQNVLRINKNGIGFSRTGYSGEFANAWTIDGNLVADFITTGTLNADLIKTGRIQGNENSECYFDLNNDELSASVIKSTLSNLYFKFAYLFDPNYGHFDGLALYQSGDNTILGGIGYDHFNDDKRFVVSGEAVTVLHLQNATKDHAKSTITLDRTDINIKSPGATIELKTVGSDYYSPAFYNFSRGYSSYTDFKETVLRSDNVSTVLGRVSDPINSYPRKATVTIKCPEDADDSDTSITLDCQYNVNGTVKHNQIVISSTGIQITANNGSVKINGMDVVSEINALKAKVN